MTELSFNPQETGLSSFDLLNANKSDISTLAQQMVQEVKDGYKDAATSLIYSRKMRLLAECLEQEVTEQVKKDANVNSKGGLVSYGTKLEVRETGVKWDFSKCNDPEWKQIGEEIEQLTNARKGREATLKTLTKPESRINEDTGEVYTVYPPVRTAGQSVVVTINK